MTTPRDVPPSWWSVDPGKNLGLARWRGPSLAHVALVRGKSREDQLRVLRELAGEDRPGLLVVELPQVYRERKVDPADLVDLAVLVGRVEEIAGAAAVEEVWPSWWKGQVRKEVMVGRIWGVLASDEKGMVGGCAPASLRHNVLDAVGIGLWRLGRLPDPGRVR